MAAPRRWTDDHLTWLKARDARGIPRREIAREFTATFGIPLSAARVRQLVGKREKPVKPIKTVRVTLDLTPAQAEAVRAQAQAFGYVTSKGPGAGQGNLETLFAAIAAGEIRLNLNPTEQAA